VQIPIFFRKTRRPYTSLLYQFLSFLMFCSEFNWDNWWFNTNITTLFFLLYIISDVSSIFLIYVMLFFFWITILKVNIRLFYISYYNRYCIKETLGITDCHLSPLKGNKWTEPRCRLLVSKLFEYYTLVMDCSSYKTLRELGLDPCKRGRFLSSKFFIFFSYYFCTQGSSFYSFMFLFTILIRCWLMFSSFCIIFSLKYLFSL